MLAKIASLAACMLAIVSAGCIPSLYPIYTDDTVTDCSGLIGRWRSEDGKQSWTFAGDSDRQCTLTYVDEAGHEGAFTARLTEIGGQSFMDLHPQPCFGESTANFYRQHWLPVHTFFRINLDGQSLDLSFINPDWLKRYLREHPDALEIEKISDSSVLLTTGTEQLRRFVQLHQDTPLAFSKPVPLVKVVTD